MERLIGKKGGKSQKAHEEGQVQLIHYKPLDSSQPSLVSVTDNVGQQSVSQSARLSTGSVDSGVGRSSSHNSYSKLFHQDDTGEVASPATQLLSAHNRGNTTTHVPLSGTDALLTKIDRDNCCAMEIKEIFSEFGASLKIGKELIDRVGNLESQVQMLLKEVRSLEPQVQMLLKESTVETSESTPNQPFSTSPSSDSPETELSPDIPTVDSQSEPYTSCRTEKRLNSDSKMARDRKFEIKRKQEESARPRPFSSIDTIPEDDSYKRKGQEVHSGSEQADPREHSSSKKTVPFSEEELKSRVKNNLPTFIRQTNWTFLLPHLVSVDLSDSVATDYLLSESKSHQEKGVQFYLRVLPSKGQDAYTRFYGCLCDEKEHLGHQSLQQLLQSCDK